MIFLRVTVLVVDLLSNQKQDTTTTRTVVFLHALNEHVMIRHNDRIEARFKGGLRDVLVRARPIGVARVHMQVDDDFMHGRNVYKYTGIQVHTCVLVYLFPCLPLSWFDYF